MAFFRAFFAPSLKKVMHLPSYKVEQLHVEKKGKSFCLKCMPSAEAEAPMPCSCTFPKILVI